MKHRIWQPTLVIPDVITVFWKLVLIKQYAFTDHTDLANMVAPRLEPVIYAIRFRSRFCFGTRVRKWFRPRRPSDKVRSGVTSSFTFLFASRLFRDFGCSAGPSSVGFACDGLTGLVCAIVLQRHGKQERRTLHCWLKPRVWLSPLLSSPA